jgi:NAD(P)-dependent dehydrogenase (short-subunit alcohol dehydrogenase family)
MKDTQGPMSLKGKTLFITGGSRGIGLAIALRAASEGANIAIAAKTVEPHPKLEGTIHTAARCRLRSTCATRPRCRRRLTRLPKNSAASTSS